MNKKKRLLVICLSVLFLLELVACGSKKEEAEESKVSVDTTEPVLSKEYVYVPSFTDLKATNANSNIGNCFFRGDKFYYTSNSLETEGQVINLVTVKINDSLQYEQRELPVFQTENYTTSLSAMEIDKEGNFFAYYYLMPSNMEAKDIQPKDCKGILIKYDQAMNQIFQVDLKDMYVNEQNTFIRILVTDQNEKLLAVASNVIYVINKDGTLEKSIVTNVDFIVDLFATVDGRVFFTKYSNAASDKEIIELDISKYAVGDTLKNVPHIKSVVKGGEEGKLLMTGDKYLYEYDLTTGIATPVLDWIDSNITTDYVTDYIPLPNGDFMLYSEDWNQIDKELVKLVKTKASDLPEKETLVFASLYGGEQAIERAVLEFNKNNSSYKMIYKSYIEHYGIVPKETYDEAITAMHLDFLSDNPPDIIDIRLLNIPNLVAKGVLADISPYLDKSTVIKREDFVSSILNCYTFDGVLITIPRSISLKTLCGKKSIVGEKEGCTIEDLLQLSRKYPDIELLAGYSKESVLRQFLRHNSSVFVDYQAGTCSFNSPGFIQLLEYADTYPMKEDYSKDEEELMQKDKVLLMYMNIYSLKRYHEYHNILGGEINCIGYPTADGSQGVYCTSDHLYGITAKSKHKNEAWACLELFWDYDSMCTEYLSDGFSSRKDELEQQIQRDLSPWYEGDELVGTQEEAEAVKALIAVAKPAFENDEEIYGIISEETGAFFHGQKSAKEVADIIQNRVSIYLSENS